MPRHTQKEAEYMASEAYRRYFGRMPSASELAAAVPQYLSDWNASEQGNAFVANLKQMAEQQEANDPYKVAEKRKTEVAGKAKEYYGSVQGLIKKTLGRDPSQAEVDHFAKMMASGDADEYTLGEALKTLPEYLEKQDATARDQLRGELTAGDTRFFTENVMPAIQSNFAQSGRNFESSGYASAMAQAAKQLSGEREQYLSGLGREDFTNRRQMSINSYLSNLDRGNQSQDYMRARGDQLSDVYRQRGWDQQDYQTQRLAYEDYLRNYGKRKSGGMLNGSTGSLLGMGLGAAFAAPTGGMSLLAGASLGGGLGGGLGSLFEEK